MSIPDGWRLVPAEMTDDMRRAIWLEQARASAEREPATEATIQLFVRRRMTDSGQAEIDRRAYRAMIAAAPKPSVAP